MSFNSAELTIHLESVGWDDASAAALREAMSAEMQLRYADRFAARGGVPAGMAVEAETVACTVVADTAGVRSYELLSGEWAGRRS